MSKSKLFVCFSVSLAVGILFASVFDIPTNYVYYGLAFFISTFAVSYFSSDLKSPIALSSLLLFFCLVGIWRMQASNKLNQFEGMLGEKQSLEGFIVEDPDVRTNKQLLTVRPKGMSQNILVTTSLAGNYAYGDWVVVEGKIQEAKNFDDFDYKNYLERYNVYGTVSYPHILVLKNNQGNLLKEMLLKVKHAFVGRVDALFEQPYNSLLTGILIGAKKTLPQNVTDEFTTTGLSHVVAVSGYNISIIVVNLGFLAYYLGRKGSFAASALFILAFIIISGASASVVRAGIMGFLLLVSFRVGRMYSVVPSLCAAAVVMLLLNPKILYYDIGFQLSFAATLGIVLMVPLLDELTKNWHDIFNLLGFRSNLITTVSAILFTLPLILFHFGRLSLVAPLANILVLPAIPAIMLFGFFLLTPFVGSGMALVAKFFMMYVLNVVSYLARIPHAAVSLKISGFVVLGLCFLILGFYIFLKRFVKKRMNAIPLPLEGKMSHQMRQMR